jgi:alpha-D-ribose 1-methylphosphonate 5-triphosphate synthase subunit PhnL
MHTISDGERRRVQLVMGLMSKWDVLLLDEASQEGQTNPLSYLTCMIGDRRSGRLSPG